MPAPGKKSAFAFPAEVARFLEVEPDDVDRMIRMDDLPASKIPKARRNVTRIYLPDFHAWLLNRSSGDVLKLRDYTDFIARFDEVARVERKKPEKKAA
jgi:hypothetical protein